MSSESGLSQYVQNSGQLLDAGNYNEVDALVLASLSYIEFEKVYPDYREQNVTVQQFAKDALASGVSLSDSQRALLEQVQNSDRYSACSIHNMAAENESSQWAAMTVDINDGSHTSVIAMRGTNGTELGWNEDFQLAYDQDGTAAQQLSAAYLQNSTAENIFLTGHSKGGNDVTSAYIMSDASVRDRVIHLDNFDGPGVNDEMRERYAQAYAELAGKLDNYYPENSVIGLLLNDNPGREHFVQCEQSEQYANWGPLGEHDPYSWTLDEEGATFQDGGQSVFSRTVNHLLDGTLDHLSQTERRQVVQVIVGMQLTDMIAGEETIYGQYGDLAETLIQKIDSLLPFTPFKNIRDPLLRLSAQLAAVVQLFQQFTPEQRLTLFKTVVLLFGHLKGAFIRAAAEEILERIVEQYRKVAKVLVRVQEELASLVNWFADTIHEQVSSWCEKIQDLFFRDGHLFGLGAGGPAVFEVDAGALIALTEELQAQRQTLQQCGQEVRQISRSLLWQVSVCAGWQVGRLASGIEEEARACGRMATALQKAGQQYKGTEAQIVATAGL